MKKLLSIAVLAMGLSASIANAQMYEEQKQFVSSALSEEPQPIAKESILKKALAFGGSVHGRIENAKDNLKDSVSGELKEKFALAQDTWKAGKAEWDTAKAKQGSKAVTVSTDEKVEDHLRSSFY